MAKVVEFPTNFSQIPAVFALIPEDSVEWLFIKVNVGGNSDNLSGHFTTEEFWVGDLLFKIPLYTNKDRAEECGNIVEKSTVEIQKQSKQGFKKEMIRQITVELENRVSAYKVT